MWQRRSMAVDHLVAMGMVESIGDCGSDPNGLVHRKLFLSVDAVPEGLALHIRHHVEQEAIGLTRIV